MQELLLTKGLLLLLLCTSMLAKEMSSKEKLHDYFKKHSILAFGDSLTKGLFLTHHELGLHPYSIQLTQLINSTDIKIIEHGVNGDVTSKMIPRLAHILEHHRNMKLAIILGGTNDLIHQVHSETIIKNLLILHKMVHNMHNGTTLAPVATLAVGIPQGYADMNEKERLQVNEELKKYASQCSHLVWYTDFDVRLNQTLPANTAYWSDDKLHFSALGSDKVGSIIYEEILNFVTSKT